MKDKCAEVLSAAKRTNPLVHFITNPISMCDCANVILAVGGRPIMAEHPLETAAITKTAGALGVNLGNISDTRMLAMTNSGDAAMQVGVPQMIDAVGVGCSDLRLKFARGYIKAFRPAVIKGNISEIKALCGEKNDASGVDAGETDKKMSVIEAAKLAGAYSAESGAVVMITGKNDIIADKERAAVVENGTARLSGITGTGCMAGALCAAFLPAGDPFYAAVTAAVCMGLSGERAEHIRGSYSFKAALLDELSELNENTLKTGVKAYEI